jgi:transposase
VKVKLKLLVKDKQKFNQWFRGSRFAYNKTIAAVKKGHSPNFFDLRTMLVTANTKKTHPEYQRLETEIKSFQAMRKKASNEEKDRFQEEITMLKRQLQQAKKTMKASKNEGVYEWELETPKDIRAGGVADVCNAYKTARINLKQGNIKFFQMKYRKKASNNHCMTIPKTMIKYHHGKIIIGDTTIPIGRKTRKKHSHLQIDCDCRMVKQHHEYFLLIPTKHTLSMEDKPSLVNYCGVDPGTRTFMTTFGNQGCFEYEHDMKVIRTVDKHIEHYKSCKKNSIRNSKTHQRVKKRNLIKMERKKEHIVDEIHWKTILHLLRNNDVIFYGNIKSHNIVRGKKHRGVNKDMNNMKFFKFKERMLFKACELQKRIVMVNEAFTTQTCSSCGSINHPECSKIYYCSQCKKCVGRDVNAAKNILMKGILSCQ